MSYCLTECAKRKLSKLKKALIEILTVISVFLIIGLVAILIGAIFKMFILSPINPVIYYHPILIGLSIMLFIFIVVMLFILLTDFIKSIYKGTKSVITNTLYSDYGYKCKIFEKCDKDK